MRSTVLVELLSSGRIRRLICYLLERLSVLLPPTEYVQTPEVPCRLTKKILSRWPFWVAKGRTFSSQTPRWRTFCVATVFSGSDYPQSWEHNLRFWKMHQSRGRVVCLERVAWVLIHMRCWVLCLLNWKFPSVLKWFWLVLLIWEFF